MALFGKRSKTLRKPSHEGGAAVRQGKQGKKLFGLPHKRLRPPAVDSGKGGKAKRTPGYRPPENL